MNIEGFSLNSLRMLHDGLARALAEDDATPEGRPKRYGIREYADYREAVRRIEASLAARGEPYRPLI